MKISRLIGTGLAMAAALFITTRLAAQGTGFTYQGRLVHGGDAANGLYEMSFALYDAATNGNAVGTPVAVAPVPVSNGLFTAALDFGANAFTGAARWLEIAVTVFDSDQPVVTLAPRQQFTPVPYALQTVNAANLVQSGSAPLDIIVNGQRALRLEPTFNDQPNVVGGAAENLVGPFTTAATIGGGYINSIGASAATIAGGIANMAAGGADYAAIGGGFGNDIGEHSQAGAIGGGYNNMIQNRASDASIGGGSFNTIQTGATRATLAGGYFNTIMNGAMAATVGGGWQNTIGPDADSAAVAGGISNSVGTNGVSSAIGGGAGNSILPNASYATIPGGHGNVAALRAFAAGVNAHATNSGSFVWSDGGGANTGSFTDNSVTFRSRGGFRVFTDNSTNGVVLAPGSGSWSSLSDRNAKEHFVATDTREILDKVAALPLASWNYKAQDKSVRHLGPTAQDFHAAFGLGESERTIASVDADGVALAAIQGLNQKLTEEVKRRDAEMEQLKRTVAELKQLLSERTQTQSEPAQTEHDQ